MNEEVLGHWGVIAPNNKNCGHKGGKQSGRKAYNLVVIESA
jgi:hypothetical protein